MKVEAAKMQELAELGQITVLIVLKMDICVDFVMKDIFRTEMEDAPLQIIVKYHIGENVLNAKIIIY